MKKISRLAFVILAVLMMTTFFVSRESSAAPPRAREITRSSIVGKIVVREPMQFSLIGSVIEGEFFPGLKLPRLLLIQNSAPTPQDGILRFEFRPTNEIGEGLQNLKITSNRFDGTEGLPIQEGKPFSIPSPGMNIKVTVEILPGAFPTCLGDIDIIFQRPRKDNPSLVTEIGRTPFVRSLCVKDPIKLLASSEPTLQPDPTGEIVIPPSQPLEFVKELQNIGVVDQLLYVAIRVEETERRVWDETINIPHIEQVVVWVGEERKTLLERFTIAPQTTQKIRIVVSLRAGLPPFQKFEVIVRQVR